jgi:hypothetical protein
MLACGQAAAQSITVTKPAANDTWLKGSSYTITWTNQGQVGPSVVITLRNSADTTDVLSIVPHQQNVGSYPWPVPLSVAAGTYRVRVRASSVIGTSAMFNIAEPPSGPIKVTAPNGGESWALGSSKQITWNPGAATGSVRIELYRNGTAPANKVGVIAPSVAASAGTYPWTPVGSYQGGTAPDGDGYRVMVSSTSPVLQDASDGPFTIAKAGFGPPHEQATALIELIIEYPKADTKWTVGLPCTVQWKAGALVKYPLALALVSADHQVQVADIGTAGGDGSHPTLMIWGPPANISEGQYCVRITSADGKFKVHSKPFGIVIQTVEYDIKPEVYQTWENYIPLVAGTPYSAWQGISVVPPGTDELTHAVVGYDYHSFVWPDTNVTSWLTVCERTKVYFFVDQYEPQKAKFISAKMHLKQIADKKLNDSHASCATGYFLLTALWTDFYNPSITTPNPTAGLNFGSTDYTIDITDTVKRWFNSTPMNYGLLLTSEEVTWGQQPKICGSAFEVDLILTFKKN